MLDRAHLGLQASSVVRVAVVGAGQIAAEHLRCLAGIPQATVVAVCDLSPALAEIAADRFGMPRWYTDHVDLLAAESPTCCT